MAQQFDYPKTETELRETLDTLYKTAKTAYDNGDRPSIGGLIEIMACETTIITAIHNIKSNKGSKTPGADCKIMQKDYLQKPYEWVIKDIQDAFKNFKAGKIRRKYIDKPGKTEKRPLGIPIIKERIIQECMRIVLEPILEAQFFKHSYGFRPMRDAQMALERIKCLVHKTSYNWIIEGDICKCFDKINHIILLKHLYHMGIKDKRVLQIIKLMLEAGIIGECEVNEDGIQQGSILSPLLSNAFLDILDRWVSNQWENKTTNHAYSKHYVKISALKRSNLKPAYHVRYADDFVIITNTQEHALWWKQNIQKFLLNEMRLNLSEEKTLITNVRKKHIHFLGYEFKVVKGKSKKNYISRTIPDKNRLSKKVNAIAENIKNIPHEASTEDTIHEINLINSQIRGLINYYKCCTWVSVAMSKYSQRLFLTGRRRLKQYNGKAIPAKLTQNLPNIHSNYETKIPSIKYRDIWIGITSLSFCAWENVRIKNPRETPFTEEGRQLYFERTKKMRKNARLDEILNLKTSELIAKKRTDIRCNFEFFMNRAYALNRDNLKCRVCGEWLFTGELYTHRINPNLPLEKLNKVPNLTSMDRKCFEMVSNPLINISHLETKTRKKIEEFRKRLVETHIK